MFILSGIFVIMSQNNSLLKVIEEYKLDGSNFILWFRNLKIYLDIKRMNYVLEELVPEDPPPDSFDEVIDAHQGHIDDADHIKYVMLNSMVSSLQRKYADKSAYYIFESLENEFYMNNFNGTIGTKGTIRKLLHARKQEWIPIQVHVLNMIGIIDTLENIGYRRRHDLGTNFILGSLPLSYSKFIAEFHEFDDCLTWHELLRMLKRYEVKMQDGEKSPSLNWSLAKPKPKNERSVKRAKKSTSVDEAYYRDWIELFGKPF